MTKKNLELASSYLKRLGIEALTASNSEQALNLVRVYQHELDTVILDSLMPESNGIELLHNIAGIMVVYTYLTSGYSRGEISNADGALFQHGASGNGTALSTGTWERTNSSMASSLSSWPSCAKSVFNVQAGVCMLCSYGNVLPIP